MLFRGNSKLGDIWTFSLPAGDSCPGETETCAGLCYAKGGFFRMPSVKISQARAFEVSKKPSFVPNMIAFIKRFGIKMIRIHAAGDFYSGGYANRWGKIIKACTGTQFYAYTRSWRAKPEIRSAVRKLSKLKNMTLWLSCDMHTGTPPSWTGCPWAYLAVDDDDYPTKYIPNLVFRDKTNTVMRRQPSTDALICPLEQGVDLPLTTCASCRICYNWEGKVLKELVA